MAEFVRCPACGQDTLQVPTELTQIHGIDFPCKGCGILVDFVPRITSRKRDLPLTQEPTQD